MTKPQKPFTGNRLRRLPKVKPLDPNVPLAPRRVAAPSPGKFARVEGQLAMDFSQDDPDALTEESA
jgi:hypothetical protein